MGTLSGGNFVTRSQVYQSFRKYLSPRKAANFAGVVSKEGAVGSKLYTGSFGYQASERGGVLNSTGAYGIAQWNGPRQTALSNFAKGIGSTASSLDTQVQFALKEASGRNINLDSISDIVNRFEVPAVNRRAGEIAGAKKISDSLVGGGSIPTDGAGDGLTSIGPAGGDFFGLEGGKGTAPETLGVPADKDTPTFAKTDALSSSSPAPWTLFGVPATIKSGQLEKEGSIKQGELTKEGSEAIAKSTTDAAEARTKDTTAEIEDETGRAQTFGETWYDLFVRGGLVGVALVLLLGAWVFFYAERKVPVMLGIGK
jgi:hypothetical protein